MAFTAILLPLLIAACGFTVDFGNMYIHKSRLQNAADAAAIAGGYAYADNKESVSSHPKANAASEASLSRNHSQIAKVERTYQARKDDQGVVYYRVVLTETVPVYFLQLFQGVGSETQVSADAYVSISGDKGIFGNLFSFGTGGFQSVNANQNPDNAAVSYMGNSSYYEGRITGIGANADIEKHYTHELLNFTARNNFLAGKYQYVKEAIANGDYTSITHDTDHSLNDKLAEIMEGVNSDKGVTYPWDHAKNLSEVVAANPGKDYIYNTHYNNPEILLDVSLPATEDNKPLYIIFDNWGHIRPQMTAVEPESRPIIFVYTGTGTLNIEGQGKFFRGIIYAPYGGVLINDHGMNFYGSVVANSMYITGLGLYQYDDEIYQGSSSADGVVGLCRAPEGISWN